MKFVVVDNGSDDQTKKVVESFAPYLNIQYLYEPRSGKNRALNCALEKADLGEIVVFTDDDVEPEGDWLVGIAEACKRWPKHSVFGGRIKVIFPNNKVPKWGLDPTVRALAFAEHDYSNEECEYLESTVPFGPNYWVRREVFDNGRRFDEALGPRPTNRIMGDETSFLLKLLEEGFKIVYCPGVIVGHRIQADRLDFSTLCRRAYWWGRGKAHIYGGPQQDLLKNHAAGWWLCQCGAIAWTTFKALFRIFLVPREGRVIESVKRITDLGYQIEAMRLARNSR